MSSELPCFLADRVARGRTDVQYRELAAVGVTLGQLKVWLRQGHLERVSRGAYLIHAALPDADHWSQQRFAYLRRARTVLAAIPDAYLVGPSAAIAHTLPVLRPPHQVHVTRDPYRRTVRPGIALHRPWCEAEPVLADGLLATPVAHTISDVSARQGTEAGLIVADAALHRHATSENELTKAITSYGVRTGVGYARRVVQLADARIESPGESRLRWLALDLGYELIPQVAIHRPNGQFVARVDFLITGTNVVLEFDGLGKYAIAEDLRAEKRRQLELERMGYIVCRFQWSDLAHPTAVSSGRCNGE